MMRGAFYKGQLRAKYRLERGDKCLPAGPLRVYTYMRAGGRTVTALDKNDVPRNALIKVMWDEEKENPYTNKIVLMDEAHNMTQTKHVRNLNWLEKLESLKEMLTTAENAVVVGMWRSSPLSHSPTPRPAPLLSPSTDVENNLTPFLFIPSTFHPSPTHTSMPWFVQDSPRPLAPRRPRTRSL
jgi:hypothetical protein